MHVQLEEMIIKLKKIITCLNLYLILLSLFRTCRTPLPLLHFLKNSTDFKELSVHVSNIFYKQNY